jgi:cell division protein FtsA
MERNIAAALDLGTTKTCAIIAEKSEGENFNILGFGAAPSEGLNRGIVVNIQKTAESVRAAMEIAINKAGIKVSKINVGVAGEHITTLKHRNYVAIVNKENEITEKDLERLEQDIRLIKIPSDRQILHIIPEEYIVDDQTGIKNPIGMCAFKLEAINHIVLVSTSAIENIKRAIMRAGFEVERYILQPLASSNSVLDENEKDLGVALIDIGGGTTDIAVFHRNALKHTKVIGVAGNLVTNDIREALGIVTDEAEKLKKDYGYAIESAIVKEKEVYIKAVGGRGNIKVPLTLLTQIIHLRMRELFSLIDNELKQSGYKNKIRAGVVLTGGGSLLSGCIELAEEVFGLPVRLGMPQDLNGASASELERPEYSTVVGLLKDIPSLSSFKSFDNDKKTAEQTQDNENIDANLESSKNKKNTISSFLNKIKEFFEMI